MSEVRSDMLRNTHLIRPGVEMNEFSISSSKTLSSVQPEDFYYTINNAELNDLRGEKGIRERYICQVRNKMEVVK
jgi:hypothetical protein